MTIRSCCSTRATGTWPPATCRCAWTWPSSWPSWRSTSGRNGPPTWPWRRRARTNWSAWCPCCSAWPWPAPPGPRCAVGGTASPRCASRFWPPAPAAAGVGVSRVVARVLHILMLVVFIAMAGAADKPPFRPPTWFYFVLAGLVVVASAVFVVPAGRRLLRARVAPTLGQVLPRLLEVAQQPLKLIEGIGGALLLSVAYILCLSACVQAFGGSVALVCIAGV